MKNSIEDIEKVENLIKRCDECKLKECINCETDWTEITSIKRIVDSYKKVLKDLQEYKRISELTKISCCTAQNCEALNTAIKGELENQKLRQENEELKNFLKMGSEVAENCILIPKIKEKIEELNIEISTCEYADDDSEEYKQEVEKNKAELLMAKKVLQQLLESEENK